MLVDSFHVMKTKGNEFKFINTNRTLMHDNFYSLHHSLGRGIFRSDQKSIHTFVVEDTLVKDSLGS